MNTGVGCHFLLQGIIPTQESNPCLLRLLHWQVDSLPLSHLGSPMFGYTDPKNLLKKNRIKLINTPEQLVNELSK